VSELEQEQRREIDHYSQFKKRLEKVQKEYDEAEQDLRLFVINRAYREAWKPWGICGAIDLPNEDGTWALQCQLPEGHGGRWHQEWSKDGRLLGEWS
jgi:hypothetical protein